MKHLLVFLLLSHSIFDLEAQSSLPILKPVVGNDNVYTKLDQQHWDKAIELYEGETEYIKLADDEKKLIDALEMGEGPLTEGPGCSWYCGGGPYKISASSHLQTSGKNNYISENSHDFNLFTAWVPNTNDGVIGQSISYYFSPNSPRINQIKIYNGYIKNSDLWAANARVSKFKLLINGQPKAILELLDLPSTQIFSIDPINSTESNQDLIVTFEILEIYKGDKYDDVAISEINFNGLDVHCFAAGTKITLADSTLKSIEDIQIDDLVLSFNTTSNKIEKVKVTKKIQVFHENLLKLKLSDREVIVTDDHPFWVEGKGWVSVNPDKSNHNYEQEDAIKQLLTGDKIFIPLLNKSVELLDIVQIDKGQMTYTLNLKNGQSFIANGMLVKTEVEKKSN